MHQLLSTLLLPEVMQHQAQGDKRKDEKKGSSKKGLLLAGAGGLAGGALLGHALCTYSGYYTEMINHLRIILLTRLFL
jgi:O-antigen/teichoic acid export membrane protein